MEIVLPGYRGFGMAYIEHKDHGFSVVTAEESYEILREAVTTGYITCRVCGKRIGVEKFDF